MTKRRVHIYLDDDVIDWLQAILGGPDGRKLSRAVNSICKSYIKQMEEQQNASRPNPTVKLESIG